MTAGFAIKKDGSHTLLIEHDPNIFPLVAFIISLGLTVMLAYFQTDYAYYSGLSLIVFTFELISRRPIRCVIDKQTGQMHYSRGGVLGLRFNSQDISGRVADIRYFEMKKHVRRGGDKFQIIVVLTGFKRLILSHDDLEFGECQRFTEKIRDFLDSDISILAVG